MTMDTLIILFGLLMFGGIVIAAVLVKLCADLSELNDKIQDATERMEPK